MKLHQKLYFDQAKSDWEMFNFLKANRQVQCHCLHFLQMSTEKLGKAGKTQAPGKIHHGFVKFLRKLHHKKQIWSEFGFVRRRDFQRYLEEIAAMAQSIENLAPNEQCAGDGPNPEYPWPPQNPTKAPLDHRFVEWEVLQKTAKGHKFQEILQRLFMIFPDWF